MIVKKDNFSLGWTLFFVFILSALLHLRTFAGLDADFQFYSLVSKVVFNGMRLYTDYFEHKPPLYFYMLLPGNLMGGRLISFFLVQLFYVSLINVLVFYCGAMLTKTYNFFTGAWTWLFFNLLTVVPYFESNLNACIGYVSLAFNLATFLLLFKTKERIETEGTFSRSVILIAGVFSGLSVLSRFGTSAILIYLLLLVYLYCRGKISLKIIVIMLGAFFMGFFLPIILMLAVIRTPLKVLYDHLIFFNSLYSMYYGTTHSYVNGFSASYMMMKKIHGCILTGEQIWSKAAPIMMLGISAFSIYFYRNRQEKRTRIGAWTQLDRLLDNPFTLWLILYAIIELWMVALQGTEGKHYPYFPAFPPLALLAALFLYYLSTNMNLSKKWVTGILCLYFVVRLGVCLVKAKDECSTVLKWPDAQLISEIKKRIHNNRDLFTLDGPPYLYLETDTISPISHTTYCQWEWDFFEAKPEVAKNIMKQLQEAKPTVVTRFVQSDIPDSVFKSFMSNYKEVGRYPISYDHRPGQGIILYVRKDSE